MQALDLCLNPYSLLAVHIDDDSDKWHCLSVSHWCWVLRTIPPEPSDGAPGSPGSRLHVAYRSRLLASPSLIA